ncbi:MAG: peptidylprolyl isomerase [Clostridia bacterium]|nr:peptidylprolyl isomerase [Clostridia bacterium]
MIKKMFKRTIALMLSLLLSALLLVSCSPSMGETLMSLNGHEISVNMYRLWLSRVKGNYGGSDDGIWDEVDENGDTYNEIFTGFVRQNAMTFLCAMYEFDKLGLKLPSSEIKEIDKTMKTILSERADGNKSTLNSELSLYGINYNILREIYVIEAKLNYLEEYLYGENGTETISENIKNEYYQKNYVRIKQIFLYTSNKPVTDETGNYVYGDDGYVKTRDFTEEELAAQKEKASQIMTSLTAGQDFDLLMTSQNEDRAAEQYPGGYYLTKASGYVEEVITAAFELEENEFKMVTSDYGIHIIKKLPLEESGYSSSKNKDFFSDFEETLKTEVFTARLSQYESKIKIDEELISKYDVKSSNANTAY